MMTPGGTTDDQPTIAALVPVLQILDSFNHRNRNQHRVAHWWVRFDLLRRSVRRLHDALEARIRHRHAQSFKVLPKKSARKVNAGTSSGGRRSNALEEDATTRVRLLLDTIIPSSFLAFSQLTADGQHAALGLVLLGLLARINSAITPLVPHGPERGDEVIKTNPSPIHDATTAKEDTTNTESMGLGVAISRDQLKLTAKPPTRHPTRDDKNEAMKAVGSKKKRKLVDSPATEPDTSESVKERKPEKKSGKKKSKKGDDFSDLFSSLM